MRFLLDESADSRLENYLIERDHNVLSLVRDSDGSPRSRSSPNSPAGKVHSHTNDGDFGELIFRRRLPHAGVIFFRLRSVDLSLTQKWLERVLTNHADHLHQFIVVTERGIRARRTER